MSMLSNGQVHVDPNNVPLASLVAQEEHVDVNFIKNNNFNNNAYRNNFGNGNYKPYPSNNSNGYGNSYGRSRMPSEERMLEIEKATKNFMQMQFEQNRLFTRTMDEQSVMLKNISHQIENLNREISGLQIKISSTETCISTMSEVQVSLINKMAADASKMHPLFQELCLIICSGILAYLNQTADSDAVFSKVSPLAIFAGNKIEEKYHIIFHGKEALWAKDGHEGVPEGQIGRASCRERVYVLV